MKPLSNRIRGTFILAALTAVGACSHSAKEPVSRPSYGASEAVKSEAPAPGTASPPAMAPAVTPAMTPAMTPAAGQEVITDPMAALDRMGAYLRSLPAFAVQAQTTKDEVLESGQKIEFDKTVVMHVKRPNQLRADVKSKGQERNFFYDGKTFTLYARTLGYYATVDAPPTLMELASMLSERYDLELPLADLFLFGTEGSSAREITSATYIGPSSVLGIDTDHYAFRQSDVDWQLWIDRGDKPLPRKLVITTKGVAQEPEFSAVYTWNLQPNLNDGHFVFVPPKGTHPIVFSPKKAP